MKTKSPLAPPRHSGRPKERTKTSLSSKVKIDDRFAKVFTDPEFSKTYKRDTRTGELITDHSLYNVEDYVELEFEKKPERKERSKRDKQSAVKKDAVKKDAVKKDADTRTSEKRTSEKRTSEKRTSEKRTSEKRAEEEVDEFRWQAESTSSSESDSEDEAVAAIREVKEQLAAAAWGETGESIPTGDSSARLAVMGCDWNTIAASDLFVLCHSSVDGAKTYEEGTPMSTSNPMVPGSIPGSGIRAPLRSDKIIRVGVYLSDFGAEKLEQERIHGPSFEELELIERRNAELKNNDGEISEATALAIRKYDRQRARYYYAVVECVDVHTAEELYSQLDGMDADFAVDGIDLRYVPDDLQKFPRQPESECTALPHNYVPPVTFDSSLKHTHAELHWDEPDPRRHQLLTKRHTEEEMNAIDLEQYLASTDTSDQEDDAERIREVRKLLLGNTAEPESDDSAKEGTFFISASGNPVRVDAGETEAEMSDREGENAKTKKRPAKERLTKEDSETRKKATRSKRSGFALLSGDPEQDADSESDEGIGDILLAHVSDGQDSSDSHSERKPKGRKSIRQRRKNALAQHRQKKRERDNTQYVESLVKKDERFGALFNDPAHFA